MNVIRVVVVDDHRVVSRGVQSYLESFSDIRIVGVTMSGEEVLEKLDEWLPEVVIMDSCYAMAVTSSRLDTWKNHCWISTPTI